MKVFNSMKTQKCNELLFYFWSMWLACFANEQQMQSIHNKHQHYLDAIKQRCMEKYMGTKIQLQMPMNTDIKICSPTI